MTNFLIKKFIKDPDNITDSAVRGKYGYLSGFVGIGVNVLLCLAKIFVGSLTHSIAITADAVHNLSDAGSSAVTVFGFKMASRPADSKHPFGHGRVEYVTAMIVSFIILFMGGELAIESVDKIKNPVDVNFSLVGAIIIAVSILFKIWLAVFNRSLGKKINSPAMQAVVVDSISDSVATGITLISLILSAFFPKLHIDGWAGIVVACFVIKAGFDVFKDTLGSLIGEPPTKETVDEIIKLIESYDYVTGTHDLMLHNYGPEKFFGSIHVEMPSNLDVMTAHDIIDNIENDIKTSLGIQMTVHYDPIQVNDERVNQLRDITLYALSQIDETLTIHDFRVVDGPTHTNLIFDIVAPHKFDKSSAELSQDLSALLSNDSEKYFCVIKVEHSFV